MVSETFRKLLGGTARHQVKKPRDHVVLDIDPVFNQAAIVQEKYKLIVGKGAIMSFDQVYPLISVCNPYFPPFFLLNKL